MCYHPARTEPKKSEGLEEIVDCAQTIPFDQTDYQSQIDILNSPSYQYKFTDYYVFRDIAKAGTGSPYDVTFDLDTHLRSEYSTSFSSRFDADLFLTNAFIDLEDVHTSYTVNVPFSLISLMHPIALDIRYHLGSDSMKVYVANDAVANVYYLQIYNMSNPHIGKEVTSINGVNAYQYLVQESQTTAISGYSKEPSTRLNWLIQHEWVNRWTFGRFPSPKTMEYSYVFDGGSSSATVGVFGCFFENDACLTIANNADLASRIPSSRRGESKHRLLFAVDEVETLFSKYPLSDPPTAEELANWYRRASTLPRPVQMEVLRRLAPHRNGLNSRRSIESNNWVAICTNPSGDMAGYVDQDDQSVGALQITTFSTNSTEFVATLKTCAQLFTTAGVDKVIVDLRYNTGGLIALGMQLAHFLMKRTKPAGRDFCSPLLVPQRTYDDVAGTTQGFLSSAFGGAVWYFPAASKKFKFPYSDRPYASLDSFGPLLRYNPNLVFDPEMDDSITYPIEPENLLILSTGTCGSACGFFTNLMSGTKSARVLYIGGIQNDARKPDPSSYDGASVLSRYFTINSGHYLSVSWAAIFPYTEMGLYDKARLDYRSVQEWTYSEPDFHDWKLSSYYDAFQSTQILPAYGKALEYLTKCAPWSVKTASCTPSGPAIENGVYGYPCVSEVFDTNACVFKRCSEGYYYDSVRGSCVAIAEAPLWENWVAQTYLEVPTAGVKFVSVAFVVLMTLILLFV